MTPIDQPLRDAFASLVEASGSTIAAAGLLGCTPKHVNAILSGRVQYIRPSTWERFRPHIEPHLAAVPDTIPAPADPKRRFVAERLHTLSDERIAELVIEIVERDGAR